ncbi:MAG: N-acetylmuramoyl-L-alanine amidase, partial [Muribaculaceae bacterium]|nr:N-acetylmuramoyl-L-alanine amidase [Muribaculaceae bacterium]
MNRLISLLLITLFCVFYSVGAHGAGADDAPFVVVLDPGHGGKDYGAIGKITNEKTINLDVGLKVR